MATSQCQLASKALVLVVQCVLEIPQRRETEMEERRNRWWEMLFPKENGNESTPEMDKEKYSGGLSFTLSLSAESLSLRVNDAYY